MYHTIYVDTTYTLRELPGFEKGEGFFLVSNCDSYDRQPESMIRLALPGYDTSNNTLIIFPQPKSYAHAARPKLFLN